jgi:DNA adenine methylase
MHRVALFIFLNKTCFNGLFRVNSKEKFNVSFGKYKNPKIYDKDNLVQVSTLLKGVKVLSGNYENVIKWVDNKTFLYLDPPYRPISSTARFTSYSIQSFDDKEQIKLAKFFRKADRKGAKLMLSNSFSEDGFFQKLYDGYNIKVIEVQRYISASNKGRGKVKEILVTNYGGDNE